MLQDDRQDPPGKETHALPLLCKNCGQQGAAYWEENAPPIRSRARIRGFHHEVGRFGGDEISMVCDECDEIVLD
jgi:hypothetical protein